MRTITLGDNGPEVSVQGLGCMGMSAFYTGADHDESVATLERALELGVTFLDTSDVYGPHTNEELLARSSSKADDANRSPWPRSSRSTSLPTATRETPRRRRVREAGRPRRACAGCAPT